MTYVVLILSSLRGMVFLFTGIPPVPSILFALTLVNIAFAIIPSRFFYYLKNPGKLRTYLRLLIISMIFGLMWYFVDLTFGHHLESSRNFLLFFIAPISVLFFLRAKDNYLVVTIYFIAIIISISCIIEFIVSNIYPGIPYGIELVRGPLEAITPGEGIGVHGFSHIGEIYRAHGITGHYHDSGNILAMASVYCIGNTFYKKKSILFYFLALVIVTGLLSTLSMSNIIAAIVGIMILVLFAYRGGLFKRIFIIAVMGYAIIFIATFQVESYAYDEIFNQFDPSGVKMTAMMNLGSSSTSARIVSMLFGHDRSSMISDMGYYTEAAIVVMLMDFGLVTFIPLMMVLCFPIYLYFISNKELRNEMWIPFVTVCTGLLTLWHYGSLFRSTSIFLFFAFYSMAIKKYLNGRYQYRN